MSKSQLVEEEVHFDSLEGNLIGDPADRSILIYLPASYEASAQKRYPVVYLLHGAGTNNHVWVGKSFNNYYGDFNLGIVLDRLIADDRIREMIVVMPDANTTFMGNWYVNSPVLGNHQDYITDELVQHIDANYRTLAHRESRGIGGHSMGGFGAINLGMHHPEIYSAVYGHESAALKFEEFSPPPFAWQQGNPQNLEIFTHKDWDTFQQAGPFEKVEFLTPATFSPNLDNPPFFGNWLWIEDGERLRRDSATWQRWKAFDPTDLVEIRKENLRQLRALKFDGGTESGYTMARSFHEALTEADIPHEFEPFTGGHFDCTASRMESVILPFFSELLQSD